MMHVKRSDPSPTLSPTPATSAARSQRRPIGVRTLDRLVGGGWFFCAVCGGDRRYERRTHHLRVAVFGIPIGAPLQEHDSVRCAACSAVGGVELLDAHTSRDLANAVALAARHLVAAVLAADGEDPTDAALVRAIEVVRRFADDGYDESAVRGDLLLLDGTQLDAVCRRAGAMLTDPGRERLLFGGIEIAAADGRVTLAELDAVRRAGVALGCTPVHIYGVIEHARAAIQ